MDDAPDPLEDAARWAARRTDRNPLSDRERAALAGWLAADPANPRRLAMLERGWRDPHVGAAALAVQQGTSRQRRLVLGAGLGATAAAAGLWLGQAPLRRRLADHASGIGEIRALAPAHGIRFLLDTASAVTRLGDARWLLAAGAVRIDLDPGAALSIEGAGSPVEAEAASLVLRRHPLGDRLVTLGGQVAVQGQRIAPGEAAWLATDGSVSRAGADPVARDAAEGFAEAWHRFEQATLSAVVAELERYRAGPVWLDAAAGRILVSGRYRFIDPEAVLAALAATLPIAIRRFGPLVRIVAR